MKRVCALMALFGLVACGPSPENDPIYQQLKANPPTEIPARHLPKLRRGIVSCDVFEEGMPRQYMTCWWTSGWPPSGAYLTYYPPRIGRSPSPERVTVPGGTRVFSGYLPLN